MRYYVVQGTAFLGWLIRERDLHNYSEVLQPCLIPAAVAVLGDEWGVLQNNDADYSSYKTKDFLENNDVEILDRLAEPPDLNIIENDWG